MADVVVVVVVGADSVYAVVVGWLGARPVVVASTSPNLAQIQLALPLAHRGVRAATSARAIGFGSPEQ